MKKYIIPTYLLFSSSFANYEHPGNKNFFEIGYLKTNSVYATQAYSPYAVLRYEIDRFTIEGLKIDYDLVSSEFVKIGPSLSVNFAPYSQKDSPLLSGLKRKFFVEYGLLFDISIPIGQIFLNISKTKNIEDGYISRAAYATGIPLLKLKSNYLWLNIYMEYSKYSKEVSQYLFGVYKNEENIFRSSTNLGSLGSFTQIYGLWTPIYDNFWSTVTLKVEKFDAEIVKSPIVSRRVDQIIMLGVLISY